MNARIRIYGCRFTVAVDFAIKFVPFAEFRRDPPVRRLVVDDRTDASPHPIQAQGRPESKTREP